MSDTWITDLRHYLDDDGDLAPLPNQALNIALHLCSIVEWMTSLPQRDIHATNVTCRRSPGRKRCTGPIHANFIENGSVIRWSCLICGDNGIIRGWQETRWDRRQEFERSELCSN